MYIHFEKAFSNCLNFIFLVRIIQIFFITVVISGLFFLIYNISFKPEKLILGEWEEVAWRYDKANKIGDFMPSQKAINQEVIEHISKDLLIHKTENWTFLSDGTLKLKKRGHEEFRSLIWKLKGRGNLLKLKYDDKTTEYYQIKQLSNKRMVLFFENEVHTRGIVKIEFKKLD